MKYSIADHFLRLVSDDARCTMGTRWGNQLQRLASHHVLVANVTSLNGKDYITQDAFVPHGNYAANVLAPRNQNPT
jgi:hypothetical protein